MDPLDVSISKLEASLDALSIKYAKATKARDVVLQNVSWEIDSVPPKRQWFSKVVFNQDTTIILPDNRYCDEGHKMVLKGGSTAKDILEAVYDFYQQKLTDEDVAKLKEEGEMVYEQLDLEKYRTEGCIRVEIMGSLIFFEGFERDDEGAYMLRLGS